MVTVGVLTVKIFSKLRDYLLQFFNLALDLRKYVYNLNKKMYKKKFSQYF